MRLGEMPVSVHVILHKVNVKMGIFRSTCNLLREIDQRKTFIHMHLFCIRDLYLLAAFTPSVGRNEMFLNYTSGRTYENREA